jgi:hypothetical protein
VFKCFIPILECLISVSFSFGNSFGTHIPDCQLMRKTAVAKCDFLDGDWVTPSRGQGGHAWLSGGGAGRSSDLWPLWYEPQGRRSIATGRRGGVGAVDPSDGANVWKGGTGTRARAGGLTGSERRPPIKGSHPSFPIKGSGLEVLEAHR